MNTRLPIFHAALRWAAAAAAMLAAGCANTPPAADTAAAPTAATTAAPDTSASRPAPGASVAGQARTFSTQLATYTAVSFDAVPGWRRDDFSESWPAFLTSCKVLTGRGAEWREVCARALKVDSRNDTAIRAFFEQEFSAYQIRDDDRRPDGVVTGYFEPEIPGSRQYAPPYIYPVYGQPEDMLFADARKLPAGSGTVAARVEGRNVVVQTGLSTRDMGAPGLYALDLSGITRDTLDRKVRLRIEGKQLLPYYTREEIETKGAPNAKVLAFVSSATALYEMQIQGSGRIKLANGDIIRVAYAEQNGQPFRPTLAQAPNGKPRSPVKVRGASIELELDDGDEDDAATDTGTIRTRGFTLARPATSGAVVVPGRRTTGAVSGSGIKDPSYVFFKESPSPSGGPVGAFGVPLSAGRSIAVDPRSTPLGYPVFVSTRAPGTGAPMQRLTIAQDTGGAIRGAVRADYFFGNGQQAANNARRMKERGQLWILLPRGLAVAQAAVSSAIRTRGAAVGAGLPQCLVPTEGVCVDD
ncbi:membrane-bound lytic murein transglycosylase A [Variovorax sp. TBS-050B]|uniref:murein transglycosylase A n=1 Tax=Variovorax sp. TBS-050B TaxID=2940551 RepID=UPI002476D8AB|nr:MltA domain-containing protein [Variovorax sp. TBS-050B]MDH6592556.1 membrane-bound lytic murein transglycosylase A [Variovorax sp. TBS-050B]